MSEVKTPAEPKDATPKSSAPVPQTGHDAATKPNAGERSMNVDDVLAGDKTDL